MLLIIADYRLIQPSDHSALPLRQKSFALSHLVINFGTQERRHDQRGLRDALTGPAGSTLLSAHRETQQKKPQPMTFSHVLHMHKLYLSESRQRDFNTPKPRRARPSPGR